MNPASFQIPTTNIGMFFMERKLEKIKAPEKVYVHAYRGTWSYPFSGPDVPLDVSWAHVADMITNGFIPVRSGNDIHFYLGESMEGRS